MCCRLLPLTANLDEPCQSLKSLLPSMGRRAICRTSSRFKFVSFCISWVLIGMTGMSFILYSHIVGMTRNQSGLDNRTKIHEKSNDVQCLGVGFSDLHFVLNAACLERLCALQHVRCNDASTQDCKGWNCPGAIPLQLIHAPLAGCRRYNSYDYSMFAGYFKSSQRTG